MNKHRMIEEKSSGTEKAAKRVKKDAQSNDHDAADEIDNPKSLIKMPDEILEQIFNSLDDLADKKSFSETCKKFNEIFGRRKNLETIWMEVPESKRLFTGTLRPYTELHLECNKSNVSNRLWNHLESSLTSLSISLDGLSNPSSFLNMLPHFTNLTHLTLYISENSSMSERNIWLNTRKQNSKIIEMKKLTYLCIDYDLFLYLDGYYINFAATNKLRTLKLCNHDSLFGLENGALQEDFSTIRSFVSNQKSLGTLHLYDRKRKYLSSIFDHPINIQSKLEELVLETYIKQRLNAHQQNNICDLLDGQDRLNWFRCGFFTDGKKIPRMRQVLGQRLNWPIESQDVAIMSIDEYSIDLSVEDFVQSADQPNWTTEELRLFVDSSYTEMNQVTPFIVLKFPNLKSIVIDDFCQEDQKLEDSFTVFLGNLKKLESLTLFFFPSGEHLKSITIPGLKYFACLHRNTSFLLEKSSADLIEFFSRHEGIQHLMIIDRKMPTEPEKSEIILLDGVAEYALKHLKNLSYLCVDSSLIFRVSLDWFIPLICRHAKPGFVFNYNSIEIMKRDDSKIVQKFQGRWQLHEINNADQM